MNYARIDWLRPLIVLKREHEGYAIPPALIIVGRREELVTTESTPEDSEGKAEVITRALGHRYKIRVNLWIIVFESVFVLPTIPRVGILLNAWLRKGWFRKVRYWFWFTFLLTPKEKAEIDRLMYGTSITKNGKRINPGKFRLPTP